MIAVEPGVSSAYFRDMILLVSGTTLIMPLEIKEQILQFTLGNKLFFHKYCTKFFLESLLMKN